MFFIIQFFNGFVVLEVFKCENCSGYFGKLNRCKLIEQTNKQYNKLDLHFLKEISVHGKQDISNTYEIKDLNI